LISTQHERKSSRQAIRRCSRQYRGCEHIAPHLSSFLAVAYNLSVAELSFFIGKGGVGKTTASAAYAIRAAVRHPRREVLLISTDPAHSLADVLNLRLGASPRRVPLPAGGRLHAWQINAHREFENFIGRNRDVILDLVEQGTIFSRQEIEPLLETTIPGMAEVAALLAIDALLDSGKYHEIVADTAPIGHTLRLFEMPAHFARFLDFLDVAASRNRVLAAHFGGHTASAPSQPFLSEWRRAVEHVSEALGAEHSRLVLVTTAESFALNESLRAADALAASSRRISSIVLNRAVTRPGACAFCRKRARDTRSARMFLARHFPRVPLSLGEDDGSPPVGVAALLGFGEHVFAGKRLSLRTVAPVPPAQLRFKSVPWPVLEAPLSLTLGKGGVGKTTVSAGLAFHQRAMNPRTAVTICSTDPAPSLDDVFETEVGDSPRPVLGDRLLQAIEVDSVAEFRRWSQEMKAKLREAMSTQVGGLHVDLSFDREVISALLDVVPPGVDEIFAIFRILDLLAARPEKLVIDMAPTGHALELLRMPARMQLWTRLLLKSLAAHRTLPLAQDVAVEIASVGQRVRELVSMLHDPRRSRLWPVMLAEPLPDRETGRLLRDLEEMGVRAAPLFVNRVIFPEDAGRCPRCRRQHGWQMATLAQLRRRGRPLYVARNLPDEIAGAQALKKFAAELWQIA
jgi:arsenite-transporting ATPase